MRFVYRWYQRSAKSIEQSNDLQKIQLRFATIESFDNSIFTGVCERFPEISTAF